MISKSFLCKVFYADYCGTIFQLFKSDSLLGILSLFYFILALEGFSLLFFTSIEETF